MNSAVYKYKNINIVDEVERYKKALEKISKCGIKSTSESSLNNKNYGTN